tara:strand:+ start:5078 stop:5968 length:891 start_codon:yes stop_codon:yes gene_type:complete
MFSQVINQDIKEITNSMLKSKKVKLLIQREDLNNPDCMGNKWWKLRFNLMEAVRQNQRIILTFGGAFSNHIAATALACNKLGLKSIGIIRGDFTANLNPTLLRAKEEGMQLQFVDRETYRNKFNIDWKSIYGDFYLIPEGGTNELAVKSCEEMVSFKDFDIVCVPVGTGGTFSGVIRGLKTSQFALGFSVLKGGDFLTAEVKKYVNTSNWSIQLDYHFGGYAKVSQQLVTFMNEFKRDFSIQLEPIYTAKMFYGIFDMIKNNYFPPNSTIIAIHTGGLQGIEGMNQRLQSKLWKID